MPVTIVDRLEQVDVSQNDRQRTLINLSLRHFRLEGLVQTKAIDDPGQRIGHRQLGKFFVRLAQLRRPQRNLPNQDLIVPNLEVMRLLDPLVSIVQPIDQHRQLIGLF